MSETYKAVDLVLTEKNLRCSQETQAVRAWDDIFEGLIRWRVWYMLAYQDIKLRYRRSVLGPFWLTISMAITVYSMGFLYSHLFHMEPSIYFPFLVSGMLGWSLVSTIVIEMIDGFLSYESVIKQIKLPYTLYMHRIVARNILIFMHNIVVIVPIYIFLHKTLHFGLVMLWVIPGLLLIYFNGITFGLILSMVGARFRDLSQIIKNMIQVVFFITPVMWSPDVLVGKNQFIADLNPFFSFLELIRAPLLGRPPTLKNWLMVGLVSIMGAFLSFSIFKKYRSRIVYWI